MTTYNQTTLKTFFETGDVPTGQNFADFIDSYVNIVNTSPQAMAGSLSMPELIAARVSAGDGNFTGTVSAASIYADNFNISSIAAVNVSATNVYSGNGFSGSVGIVSAAGSSQATAAPLSFATNIGTGVVDGQTTGFLLASNKSGLVQYIINGGVSANLWPCIGGQINALSSNAAFAMAANTPYQIIHIRASGYAVK